ncbi:hypothetical protein EBZ80_24235 [bacterium]|nr:hypothetical protein [Betaproteobacteria bacterium]NDE18032.1 hypothetical protein [bacterium]
MTIDEAIDNLKRAKKKGVKSVILAWWSADMFGRSDDSDWERSAEIAEDKMDWSTTHSDLASVLDLYAGD